MNSHYRGVEFSLDPKGGREWMWEADPRREGVMSLRGELVGSRADAMKACFRAIDDALDITPEKEAASLGVQRSA